MSEQQPSEPTQRPPIAFTIDVQVKGRTVMADAGNAVEDFEASMRRVAELLATVLGESLDLAGIEFRVNLHRAAAE